MMQQQYFVRTCVNDEGTCSNMPVKVLSVVDMAFVVPEEILPEWLTMLCVFRKRAAICVEHIQ